MQNLSNPVSGLRAWLGRWARPAQVVVTIGLLTAGGVLWLVGSRSGANGLWAAGTVFALIPASYVVVSALIRRHVGVDLIALLSLIGTLLVGEHLAGALIGVMLATGHALDAAAEQRASRDLRALLDRTPRTAKRRTGDAVESIPLEQVVVGDLVIVGPGEVVPVDGEITDGVAILDESALTGEPLSVERRGGDRVRSGVVNAGPALELRTRLTADQSTYAGIVRLAQDAAAESAPVIRLADRVAVWFMPLALGVAGLASLISASPTRAVAVLVVATPCPLLLAAPVAIVSGMSRASRVGVVVRSGSALENLGHATTLVMDKTGTLTSGRPTGTDVVVGPGRSSSGVLRLAASADQLSPHVLAEAIVHEANIRHLDLSLPTDVVESAGTGVSAVVDGRRVTVGNLSLQPDAPRWATRVLNRAKLDSAVVAWVTVDHELAGAIMLVDPLRPDASRTLRRLREAGMNRLIMLTGDRRAPAEAIGRALGLDTVYAEQTPKGKVAQVRAERESAVTVMVGDGVNDAPALAAATVGVAMGARGSTASSEAADIVLTADHIERLADAIDIARHARRIAVQSATVGMGLSLVAMGFAAFGLLPPALGALLQELIDVAVILNALRALRPPPGRVVVPAETGEMLRRFSAEHEEMRDQLSTLRETADLLADGRLGEGYAALRRVDTFLHKTLLPHIEAEESQLYPALHEVLGGSETTATMSRMHVEIDNLAHRLNTHLEQADRTGGLQPGQVADLLSGLYGLHALLRLHFVQQEENYFALIPAPVRREPPE